MTKYIFIIILSSICFTSIANAQEFNDIIVTTQFDTIHCKIGLINNYNVFYEFNPKKKKIVSTFISREKVHTFSINSPNIDVFTQEIEPNEEEKDGLIEDNGIIYSSHLDSPPSIKGGINVLYSFLEKNVKVYINDIKVFKKESAVVLFKLTIQEDGKTSDVTIKQSASYTGGFSYETRNLENEIQSNLMSFIWSPAILDKTPVPITIYLPLKFRLNNNKIILLPSEKIFNFKGQHK